MSRAGRGARRPEAGARLSVLVTARASSNSVEALDDGSIRVHVTAPPADGRANHAVVRLLADALGVAPGRLRIVSGASARAKVVLVTETTADQLAARLREIGR